MGWKVKREARLRASRRTVARMYEYCCAAFFLVFLSAHLAAASSRGPVVIQLVTTRIIRVKN